MAHLAHLFTHYFGPHFSLKFQRKVGVWPRNPLFFY
nr:MAG TPA: hypothetical protein [Caudoviricetes sp.]